MNVLELIPQVFYDLISRVIAGAVAIVAVAMATGNRLGALFTELWAGSPAVQGSAFLTGLGPKIEAGQVNAKRYSRTPFVWYDWLRVNSPDAGARAAKIREDLRR